VQTGNKVFWRDFLTVWLVWQPPFVKAVATLVRLSMNFPAWLMHCASIQSVCYPSSEQRWWRIHDLRHKHVLRHRPQHQRIDYGAADYAHQRQAERISGELLFDEPKIVFTLREMVADCCIDKENKKHWFSCWRSKRWHCWNVMSCIAWCLFFSFLWFVCTAFRSKFGVKAFSNICNKLVCGILENFAKTGHVVTMMQSNERKG